MTSRLMRYHRIAALADAPTALRRLAAGAVAGALAFALTQLLLGVLAGAGAEAIFFSSIAFPVAAAVTAATMRRARAVVYGIVGAVWLVLESLVLLVGGLAALG